VSADAQGPAGDQEQHRGKSAPPAATLSSGFTAEKVLVEDHHAHLTGALTIGGQTRPASVDVDLEPAADGLHAHGVVQIRQTDFGIKPYSALMGMLKVADQLEVAFDGRLPSGAIST